MFIRFLAIIIFLPFLTIGQTLQDWNFKFIDADTKETLTGVKSVFISPRDSSQVAAAISDLDGIISLKDIKNRRLIVRANLLNYEAFEKMFPENPNDQKPDTFTISLKPKTLGDVKIEDKIPLAGQKNDTVEFQSGSYKVNPDASSEDLVKKMPGIVIENGQVKAQGENVKQVLVDGKPFFGEDPSSVLKTLPADMVEKVQVYDRGSDQAGFSGFGDGNTDKTINIITRSDKKTGQFGKIYAGYGTDNRYIAGTNANWFHNNRRLSFILLSNNINQQNFSSQDLMGILNSSGGGMGMRGGGMGGMRGGMGMMGRGMMGGGTGTSPMDFMVGQQNGIALTHAAGINYSDKWGKKVYVSGSYFFNYTDTDNDQNLFQNYFSSTGLQYSENTVDNRINQNHRANFRLEAFVDSMNSFVYTPRVTFQNAKVTSDFQSVTLQEESPTAQTQTDNGSKSVAYNTTHDLLYRRKFKKPGRNFSMNLTATLSNKDSDGTLDSYTETYQNPTWYLDTLIQKSNTLSPSQTYSANASYVEALGDSQWHFIQASYRANYTHNSTTKYTRNRDLLLIYSEIDTSLSNEFVSDYIYNRPSLSYRYNRDKINFNIEAAGQLATLDNSQKFPLEANTKRNFTNVLPSMMLQYKFNKNSNLRFVYRTSTTAPTVNQLQNVINNSNPLQLSSGNSNLRQDYTHFMVLRYMLTKPEKNRTIFAVIHSSLNNQYIGSQTLYSLTDTVVSQGVNLAPGVRMTIPVNLSGYLSTRAVFNFSQAIKPLKINVNLTSSGSYTQTPSLLNNDINYSRNYTLSQGLSFSSNISEKIDFSLGTSANYPIVLNSLQPEQNSTYFYLNSNAQLNWIFWKGFFVQTDVLHQVNSGLSTGYNQNFILWNAGIGKKLFKNQLGDIRLTVFDILKQNRSIVRNVTDQYTEDINSSVLTQFFMLKFTYTFKNFRSGKPAEPRPEEPTREFHQR